MCVEAAAWAEKSHQPLYTYVGVFFSPEDSVNWWLTFSRMLMESPKTILVDRTRFERATYSLQRSCSPIELPTQLISCEI